MTLYERYCKELLKILHYIPDEVKRDQADDILRDTLDIIYQFSGIITAIGADHLGLPAIGGHVYRMMDNMQSLQNENAVLRAELYENAGLLNKLSEIGADVLASRVQELEHDLAQLKLKNSDQN